VSAFGGVQNKHSLFLTFYTGFRIVQYRTRTMLYLVEWGKWEYIDLDVSNVIKFKIELYKN